MIYWIIEKVGVENPRQHELVQTLKGLGFSSVLLIAIGVGGEALFILIDVLLWIVEKVRNFIKRRNNVCV